MKTAIARAEGEALIRAKELISAGEVVAFHTETVYGLGADARSDSAVQKIFALKGRPADNPLIVHVAEGADLTSLIDEDPPYCALLREAFLPGPLTLVYPSHGKVSRFVSCGLDTLAVRVPSSPCAQAFLRAVGVPIAAPSANVSKHVSPVTAEHVYADFEGKIPLILDGGACSGGIESTVLDCTGDVPAILREGLITREEIARVAGDCRIYHPHQGEKPRSPGMAYRHYCPKCETLFFEDVEAAKSAYAEALAAGKSACILCENGLLSALEGYRVLDLGRTGEEMAERLYRLLREAERGYACLIGIEPKENGGVMAGVKNRLHRAFGVEV